MNPTPEDIANAERLLANPIDLNLVGFSAVFPICSGIVPKRRTFHAKEDLKDHFFSVDEDTKLTFPEIEQIYQKYCQEHQLDFCASPSVSWFCISDETFAIGVTCYSLNEEETSFYLEFKRCKSDCSLGFLEHNQRIFPLLKDTNLGRAYLANEYTLEPISPPPNYDDLPENFSFDDLM